MSRLLPLLIFLILLACKVEQRFYRQAFYEQNVGLNEGDTLIFPFMGKTSSYQDWKGDLIAFQFNGELKIHELGTWEHYNPADPLEIWETRIWDSEGSNLVIMYKLHNTKTDELWNTVYCNDTTINNVELRKCDYKWYHDNGSVMQQYSIVTFENPDSGKLYGTKRTFNADGTAKSVTIHEPKITAEAIK